MYQDKGKLFKKGKNLRDILLSVYANVLSSLRDLHSPRIVEDFPCPVGVRQGECLSPYPFVVSISDLEDDSYLKGKCGVNIYSLKIYLCCCMLTTRYLLLSDRKTGLRYVSF